MAATCPDPFGVLNAMNAYTGVRTPVWTCAGGVVPPPPTPPVYGRNEFRDIFEMTTQPGGGSYDITFAGSLYVADEWRALPGSIPPDCGAPGDPGDDVPGQVTYAPFVRSPIPFVRSITVTTAPPIDCLGDRIADECQRAFTERLYSLTGTSAGTPWSWCINAPRFPSVCNTMVPGVPAGQPAMAVATAFANSINAASCPDSQLFAKAYSLFGTTYLVVSVASEVTGDNPFDLCVGPGGGPATCCPVMAFSSCTFNPTMTRIPTSGADCNGNGRDDTIDILTGRSADANQDGIPDDCQGVPCRADFNQDNVVNSQDFFNYLAAFFANNPSADFNRDQTVNSQDFFDFLAAFFAGC